jgi:citrate synthase
MGDALSSVPVGGIGAGSLVALVVLLMLTGKIPTLRELRDSQRREQRAMDLAEKWQQVATEHGMTLHQILDGLEVANHAMTEIQAALRRPEEKAP